MPNKLLKGLARKSQLLIKLCQACSDLVSRCSLVLFRELQNLIAFLETIELMGLQLELFHALNEPFFHLGDTVQKALELRIHPDCLGLSARNLAFLWVDGLFVVGQLLKLQVNALEPLLADAHELLIAEVGSENSSLHFEDFSLGRTPANCHYII